MSEEKNHTHFTAEDIEKYHRGLLSVKQMHDLEKAALDDPFLADALEGYATTGVNVAKDIEELKQRLSEKTETGKIAVMYSKPKPRFQWWKVAAIIVLVTGAGLLVYQLGYNKKPGDIAQAKPGGNKILSKDSVSIIPDKDITADKENDQSKEGKIEQVKPQTNSLTVKVTNQSLGTVQQKTDTALTSSTNYTFTTPTTQTSVPSPQLANGNNANSQVERKEAGLVNNNVAKVNTDDRARFGEGFLNKKVDSNTDVLKDKFSDQNTSYYKTLSPTTVNKNLNNIYNSHNNIFRGRVVDANNNALPFANVTNISDSIGTYADAKGNFNFISPDSILNVEVRSVGFNNMNAQLRNNVANNQVIMREDRSLNEVVISNKRPNATLRSHDDNMKLEEPEPADGWDNYDTYLANNLNVPDEIKEKKTTAGEVEISFEVDKNGEPVRFKVEKSLCSKCDQEAIRLIKHGPKWKRKANKSGRTTVMVPFDL